MKRRASNPQILVQMNTDSQDVVDLEMIPSLYVSTGTVLESEKAGSKTRNELKISWHLPKLYWHPYFCFSGGQFQILLSKVVRWPSCEKETMEDFELGSETNKQAM